MACLNMLNNDQQTAAAAGPRISFSNDFVDAHQAHQQQIKNDNSYKEAPVSSDFEFSLPSNSMISADEVIFKGKLLPLKEHSATKNTTTTTLRDELLAGDDDGIFLPRVLTTTRNSSWWKERLCLKRSFQIAPSRPCETLERIDETKTTPELFHDFCIQGTAK